MVTKLAKVRIPPEGGCLSSARLEELGRPDARWSDHEVAHLERCNWCRYLWMHGETGCIRMARLIALSLRGEPTEDERRHLARCPACSWEYQEMRRPTEEEAEETSGRAARR